MNLTDVILAFLAGRYPAAYQADAILQRVNRSGLLDKPATEAELEDGLRVLANRFKAIEPQMLKLSGKVFWTSTDAGVTQWHLDGKTYVG
jgi:hypothetical protein